MGTLISADDTWVLWTVLALSAALSIYLEQKYKWASKITGCILATLFTLILANLNIIPTDAPVYDAAEKIRQAVAAILPEGATPKAEAQEMPSETAIRAVKQAQETVQTGGLVLIETDPAALKAWAAQPEVQTGRGIRRSEQPKPSEAATVPAEEMIQVETRQG